MFGAFLVREGLASPSDIVQALDEQHQRSVPLGKLGLRSGKLTIKQVWRILDVQARKGGLFGDIAVGEGFMTADERDLLLARQSRIRPKLGELLVERGVLSREQLEFALERYHSLDDPLEMSGEWVKAKLRNDPAPPPADDEPSFHALSTDEASAVVLKNAEQNEKDEKVA